MERCVKLDLDIDLEPYADALINRPSEHGPKSNPITRNQLLELVPELKRFDDVLRSRDLMISYPSVMSMRPGIYGIVHVDGELPGTIHDMKFNMPIRNGTSMTTRWYDLSGLPYDRIDWNFDRTNLSEADLWFLNNAELLVNEHCIESMLLDGPYLFNSGSPHNVDGRHSTVVRTILGMNIVCISTDLLLQWKDRDLIMEAVTEYNQNS